MPDTHFDVTVIVVNWNRERLLQCCLQSLARQEDARFEVIVVDNGSTDGSIDAVDRFAKSVSFPVVLLKNRENRGFCAANNQGIAAARSAYIALLNNDAEAEPCWLGSLLSALEARPLYGMAACKILVAGKSHLIDKAAHLIYLDGQNRGRGSGELDRGQYDRLEDALWPDGCAALYRKAMLDEIGGFDEDFFAYADDAELGLRARIAGWNCVYVPQAVVRHHRGSTLGLLSSRRLQLIERNRIWMVVKHFPAHLLALNWLYFALRVMAGAWAAVRGKGEAGRFPGIGGKLRMGQALLMGTWHGWRGAPAMWSKRKAFHSKRKLSSAQTTSLLRQYRIGLKELSENAV